nr:dephospho-CoA kinase [Phytoactinopolyspora alkaliphila]
MRVGLTGGIGAGKSTVARHLGSLGAVVIDADHIAREVVAPGTAGFEAVVAHFGHGVVKPDGSLDRPALGRLVFADDERRSELNAIVHPRVHERRTELVAAAPVDAVVVEDIPLLVENGLAVAYPLVIVVHAEEGIRIERLVSRGLSADDARARIRAQATVEERRAAADVWLDNSGPVERLLADVGALWADRLVDFEANCRQARPAPRPSQPVIEKADASWAATGNRLVARIEHSAGDRARRVDHVGSTAVPGLPAKDVIDVQVVADDLATAVALAAELSDAGFAPMPGRWFDTLRDGSREGKSLACNADPARAVNVHVRPAGSPAVRDVLLFRDWLRDTPEAVREYADLKRRLSRHRYDRMDDYAAAKTPWLRTALARADTWAERTGWISPTGH